jgi:hypothetical protein
MSDVELWAKSCVSTSNAPRNRGVTSNTNTQLYMLAIYFNVKKWLMPFSTGSINYQLWRIITGVSSWSSIRTMLFSFDQLSLSILVLLWSSALTKRKSIQRRIMWWHSFMYWSSYYSHSIYKNLSKTHSLNHYLESLLNKNRFLYLFIF